LLETINNYDNDKMNQSDMIHPPYI